MFTKNKYYSLPLNAWNWRGRVQPCELQQEPDSVKPHHTIMCHTIDSHQVPGSDLPRHRAHITVETLRSGKESLR